MSGALDFARLPAKARTMCEKGARDVTITTSRHHAMRVVAAGEPCFTRDVRARVDTKEAQDWISQTIADAVGGHGRHD